MYWSKNLGEIRGSDARAAIIRIAMHFTASAVILNKDQIGVIVIQAGNIEMAKLDSGHSTSPV